MTKKTIRNKMPKIGPNSLDPHQMDIPIKKIIYSICILVIAVIGTSILACCASLLIAYLATGVSEVTSTNSSGNQESYDIIRSVSECTSNTIDSVASLIAVIVPAFIAYLWHIERKHKDDSLKELITSIMDKQYDMAHPEHRRGSIESSPSEQSANNSTANTDSKPEKHTSND